MSSSAHVGATARPTGIRDTTKRNDSRKISDSRNTSKHDSPTASSAPPKKTRRPTAELAPQPVGVPEPLLAPAFDVKSIVPQTKSAKTIEQLREASSSKKKNQSVDTPLLCIDGEIRPLECSAAQHRRTVSEVYGGNDGVEGPNKPREQFRAFGIEAFPTKAIYNDICADFVRPGKWCSHGAKCYRIHPLHKHKYLAHVLQSRPRPLHAEAPLVTMPMPVVRNASELSVIAAALPTGAAPFPPIRLVPSSTSNPSTDPYPLPPLLQPTHVSTLSMPNITGWNDTGDSSVARKPSYPSSDTSSSDQDHTARRRVRRVPPAPFPDDDPRAWDRYPSLEGWSDSDDTVEDEVPRVVRAPRSSSQTVMPPTASSSTSNNTGSATQSASESSRRHEVCRRFLQNRCPDGNSCRFDHPSPAKTVAPTAKSSDNLRTSAASAEFEPTESVVASPTHTFSMTMHDHMRVTFGAGFTVENILTGFESQWVFITGLPKEISDAKVQWLLHPHGDVVQVTRLTSPAYHGFKAQFAKASDAYKAFSTLNNSTQYGARIALRMSTSTDGGGGARNKIKDNTVHVEWEYRTRSVVVGYASEALRQRALARARTSLYRGAYAVRAVPHEGLPACGEFPVRFDDLPGDPSEEEMAAAFGPCKGLVMIQRLLPGTALHQDSIEGVESHFRRFHKATLVSIDMQPPPYSKGKMRAWAEFKTAADAQKAAADLNGRKPPYTNRTRVTAVHYYSFTSTMAAFRFRGIEGAYREFANRLAQFSVQNGQNCSAVKNEKGGCVFVKLLASDMTLLGRIKTDWDKIVRGEVVMKDGKVVWDRFFSFSGGALFLEDLQQELPGLRAERHPSARTIRLWGSSYVRNIARDRIVAKIAQLTAQRSHIFPLTPRLVSAMLKHKFQELKNLLGFASETLFFDLWHNQMKVRGDEKVIQTVSDFIDEVRKEVDGQSSEAVSPKDACPICLGAPSSPVNLPCGHSACKSCMQSYLLAATELKSFPLKCLGAEGACTQLVPLSVAKAHLSAGDGHALLHAAFAAHVERRPGEFHYCPTPDCPQIYRPVASAKGCVLQCPACLVKLCAGCSKDAHEGLTCREVNEGDQLFREWMGSHDARECPKCKMVIEKIDGCNHIQCGLCKAHVCWECMATFNDSGETYGHMRDAHGGFGLGPIL